MKPLLAFQSAMGRADHLLRLYDILHNTRSYEVRKDWGGKFKKLMHWPKNERIVRVDGVGSKSLLVLRESLGLTSSAFAHDFVSELLRSSVVATISALDRYAHDLVIAHSVTLLNRTEKDIPVEFRKLTLPIIATKRALLKLRADPKARTGSILKSQLQAQLHREYTFQRPDDVLKATKMLGVEDFWERVATAMPGTPTKAAVIGQLGVIAKRRNQIVHEADMVLKTKAKKVTLREITRADAGAWCAWMRQFVSAMDTVVAGDV